MSMNPILHVEIPASDLDRAITFYQRWLQVAVDEPIVLHDCRMAYLPFSDEAAGASIALVHGADYLPSEQGARIYIGVDDLDASLERALQGRSRAALRPGRCRRLARGRDPRQRRQPYRIAGAHSAVTSTLRCAHL